MVEVVALSVGVFLIFVGAVLYFLVEAESGGFDPGGVGLVLIAVGVLFAVAGSLVLWLGRRRPSS